PFESALVIRPARADRTRIARETESKNSLYRRQMSNALCVDKPRPRDLQETLHKFLDWLGQCRLRAQGLGGGRMHDAAIGSTGLYTNLDRIANGLAALGIGPADPIAPEQLFHLDQWHYHGTAAIDAAARSLAIAPGSRVLEVGSGIGGPARYLAH